MPTTHADPSARPERSAPTIVGLHSRRARRASVGAATAAPYSCAMPALPSSPALTGRPSRGIRIAPIARPIPR
jgi:hypothetical protein